MKGCLQKSGISTRDDSIAEEFIDPDTLFDSDAARFLARAPHAISLHAPHLWKEALGRVEAGWLLPGTA